ncbi:MAG: diaminopimelate epimerase [Cycloclasticus sp. symbiont of Poecilosclerida sp. M]|nr:MAG: diaminopimelate epimerase [Cycloclasticus sp. symbiont of Poecilosclerida sp. M]
MHGLGNDFVVIDAINQAISLSAERIQQLADRNFGIGFDQLLLVEKAKGKADFRYVIYNADGSEVSQCGNGARCFALFVKQKGLTDKTEICVETGDGELVLQINEDDLVAVNMGVPRFSPSDIPLSMPEESAEYSVDVEGQMVRFSALSIGNPHAVIQVDDVDDAPVSGLGAALESHAIFPQRVNIGFAQTTNSSEIKLRVYERGAGETLACGSGACAAAVLAIELGTAVTPVTVNVRGGFLKIDWQGREKPVLMTGPAIFVFDGTIEL